MNDRRPTPKQIMRHRLVAAWRGVADGPLMDLPTVSVADLAPKIVAQCGLANRVKLEDVLAAWEEIVGTFLFKLTRPDTIERGILTVRLMQPTAHHALSLEKAKILKRLQAKLPDAKIRDIRFRHG
ncbi:MAG: DUF721 domain-containing protein [Prosthecobacter sp.]|jgi:hypothetical protein|uniref:DUF721 domain-containing protein n=1 Tax=Prosthecobacter sp. TaxID=1965333 RepID=UPI0019E52CB8|nr:DUF721 domain-containing protein [Prosthecobacter sp.]MBE2285635.1 DUF721 domain-containing protein [Prosthecobacter sp.]